MPDQRRHRGPHPEDARLFAPDQIPAMQTATTELSWLLSRGYVLASSLKLVGDRHGLTARQRTAVSRCTCTEEQRRRREAHQLSPADLKGQSLWIDGYNVLTSIEAALSGGVLLRGQDGCIRDMASMHGSYRKVSETVPALRMIGEHLQQLGVSGVRWLLDAPVSNSGRLRSLMLELATEHGWDWEVDLVPDPDPILAAATEIIASADSEILNAAERWYPLANDVIGDRFNETFAGLVPASRPL
ncbi:MAG: DUF434 domain-containing protein [Planctomycetaceae bacterium]|nr:DUF434 domain-containing protein [Planctomycetaceae bacterium]MCB9952716.1 DUF434 domain-containing protein [Planctomycetaceae bacterium]